MSKIFRDCVAGSKISCKALWKGPRLQFALRSQALAVVSPRSAEKQLHIHIAIQCELGPEPLPTGDLQP
jgi:hypothetical protein